MNKINKKFRMLMLASRTTNYDVSKYLKCSATTVSNWKTGKFVMNKKYLDLFKLKLKKHLQVLGMLIEE